MSGLEALAIITAVAAVVSVFNDGNTLVRQIKDKQSARKAPLPPQSLEESLELGPVDIEAQTDNGLRDFGQEFANGDLIAVTRLKDIEVELQRNLLAQLQSAAEDDTMVDFGVLERASNWARVHAIKALCELYERLGAAAGIKDIQSLLQIRAQQYPYGGLSQTASYSPQRSSDTSSAVKLQQHSMLDKISQTAANQAPWDPSSYGELALPGNSTSGFSPTLHSRNTSGSMGGATLGPRTQSEEPPTSKGSEVAKMYSAPLQDPKRRKSSFLSKFMMRTPSNESNGRPSIRRSKSDNPSDSPRPTSRSSGSPSWYRSGSPYDGSRPVTQVTDHSEGNLDEITENVWELEDRLQDNSSPTSTRPIRTISAARTGIEVMEPHYSTRFYQQQPPPAPLILPSASNNYGGFCEGAWRMQIGDPQVGMKRRQDVGPGASTYYFWKCMSKQCAFSGSMFGTKKAPSFDARVRKSKSGIRFRWSFLAKSHVAQAKVVNGQYNYGCIFCCTGPEPTPVFGGIDTLLEHLLTHKGQGISAQVLQRAGCVVDRLAGDDEEFDLNVPPFAGDDGQVITF